MSLNSMKRLTLNVENGGENMFEEFKRLMQTERINTLENEALFFLKEKGIDEKELEEFEFEFQEFLWERLDEELPNWIDEFLEELEYLKEREV